MEIRIIQKTIEAQLGMPKFSGVKVVHVAKRNHLPSWLCIRFMDGIATLPRGYRAVENNGEVEMRDL